MPAHPGGTPPSWWPEWMNGVMGIWVLLMAVSIWVYVPLALLLGVGLFLFVFVVMGVEAVRHLRGKTY